MKINNKWDMAAARALIERTPENSVAKFLLSDCCDEIESLQAKLTLANELLRLEKDKVRRFKKAQEAGKYKDVNDLIATIAGLKPKQEAE